MRFRSFLFLAFLALGLFLFFLFALGLFLLTNLLQALFFEQRVEPALFFLRLPPQLLAVVRLGLRLLDDRFRFGLGLGLGLGLNHAGRCDFGNLGDERRLHGQWRKRRRPRQVVGHDHGTEDQHVQ